jgi:hypothetical protein
MAIAFRVVETQSSSLWDFGWLDRTFFAIESGSQPLGAEALLDALVRDPIFQISHRQLEDRIDACLSDATWTEAPSREQLQAVEGWLQQVRDEAEQVWALAIPDSRQVRVEWDFIWMLFLEFACLWKNRQQMQIVVLGYD